MGNLNTVTMSGRLTRDPEWRDVGEAGVCGLSLAVNERFKGKDGQWQDRAGFFDWAVWRGLGKWCLDNLHKGDLVVLSGKAQFRSWEQDGKKRSAVNFTALDVEMAASNASGNGGAKRESQSDDDILDFSSTTTSASPDIPF
jgi:single-strand DNA-binding protein